MTFGVATGFYLGHIGTGELAAFRLTVEKVIIDGKPVDTARFLGLLEKEKEDQENQERWIYSTMLEMWEEDPTGAEQVVESESGEILAHFQFVYYPDILVKGGNIYLRDFPTIQVRLAAICRWMVCLTEMGDYDRETTETIIEDETLPRLFQWVKEMRETYRLLERAPFGSFSSCCS
jgi:hypothetical protein